MVSASSMRLPPSREERDRFETPKRPYDYDDLTKVEAELEDMMQEMRGKIRH